VITRRGFLKTITTAAGLMILDPSALIEQVGTTFYSFPPAQIPAQSGLLFKTMLAAYEQVYEQVLEDLRRDINRQLFGDGFRPKLYL